MAIDDQVNEFQVDVFQQHIEELTNALRIAQAVINQFNEQVNDLEAGNEGKTLRIKELEQQIETLTDLMTKSEDELNASLLEIDSLKKEKTRLLSRMSRLERENQEYVTDISTLRIKADGNKQLIQSLKKDLASLGNKNSDLDTEINNLLAQKELDDEQINRIQDNLNKAKELNHDLQETKANLLTINAQLEADKQHFFDENEDIRHQLHQLENTISILQDNLNDTRQQLKAVNEPESEDDRDSLYYQIPELSLTEETIKNRELTDEIIELKQRIESIQQQSSENIVLLEKKNTELQVSIASTSQSLDKISQENQEFNEILMTRQYKIDQLQSELEQKNIRLSDIEPQLADNQTRISELNQHLAKQEAAHQEALAQVQANLKIRNEQITLSHNDIRRLQGEHAQVILEKSTQINDLQRQNGLLQRQQQDLQAQHTQEIERNDKQRAELQEQLQANIQQQASQEEKISALQHQIENLNAQNSQNQQNFEQERQAQMEQDIAQDKITIDTLNEDFIKNHSFSESTSKEIKSNIESDIDDSQDLPEESHRVGPPSYDYDMADIPDSLKVDYEPSYSPIESEPLSFESSERFSSSSSDPETQKPSDESSDESIYDIDESIDDKVLVALKREISRSNDYELLDMIREAETKKDLQKRTEFNGLNRKHLALLPDDNDIALGLAGLAEARIAELEAIRLEIHDKGLTPLSDWEDIQQHQNDMLKKRFNEDIRPLQYLRRELTYLSSKPYLWLNPAFQGSAKRYSSQLVKPMQELSNATDVIVPYLNRQRCQLVEALAALPDDSDMDGLPILRRNQVNHQRQLFERYLRNVKMELNRYLPLQTLFNGDDSKDNFLLKQGLIKTIEQAQENKKDIKLINQFETTSEDYPISEREERLINKDTTIEAHDQQSSLSDTIHFKYQMIDRIEPDTFREYTITEKDNLVGRFIEERTSFPDQHDDEIKLTANLFPDASNHHGRVQYAMTMAAQLLAGLSQAPSKDNPIVLRGQDLETITFLWTALMVLGESTPGMTFDKSAIKVMSTAFKPENETGLWTRFSFSSCYNRFFKGNNVVKSMKNAYKDVISDKMGHAKEHAAVVDKAVALTQQFKGNLKNIEASHREEENDSPRPFGDSF